ncbi:hypothetical protein GCM10027039_41700 [Terrabacter koreensis]
MSAYLQNASEPVKAHQQQRDRTKSVSGLSAVGGAEGTRTPDLLIANRCRVVVVLVLVRCMRFLGALGGWAFWGAGDTGGTRLEHASLRSDGKASRWVAPPRRRLLDSRAGCSGQVALGSPRFSAPEAQLEAGCCGATNVAVAGRRSALSASGEN